jgi:hypothetical protein
VLSETSLDYAKTPYPIARNQDGSNFGRAPWVKFGAHYLANIRHPEIFAYDSKMEIS